MITGRCSRGYADAEIEAVFAKYDLDNDRVLDEAEQRKMQADLDGQRVSLYLPHFLSILFLLVIWHCIFVHKGGGGLNNAYLLKFLTNLMSENLQRTFVTRYVSAMNNATLTFCLIQCISQVYLNLSNILTHKYWRSSSFKLQQKLNKEYQNLDAGQPARPPSSMAGSDDESTV